MSAPESLLGFDAPYYAIVDGGAVPVKGLRVGHFMVRKGNPGEVSNVSGDSVDFSVQFLPPGMEVADSASMNFGGLYARARALFFADELSRHVVVDARGFKVCALSWPGFRHLYAQDEVMIRGDRPVPWHHTLAYDLERRCGAATLRAEEAA
jgi:hypothetical protein